jgi:hypothetical protein
MRDRGKKRGIENFINPVEKIAVLCSNSLWSKGLILNGRISAVGV